MNRLSILKTVWIEEIFVLNNMQEEGYIKKSLWTCKSDPIKRGAKNHTEKEYGFRRTVR